MFRRTTTVILIGGHSLQHAFLGAWLGRFDRLSVVAEADDGKKAMELLHKYKPALVLMDFDDIGFPSLDILIRIRTGFPKTRVIIYCSGINGRRATKLIRAGAAVFVLKTARSGEMEDAIRTVLDGGVYLSPDFLMSLGTGTGQRMPRKRAN